MSRAAFDAIASTRPEIYRYITLLLTRRLREIDAVLKATSFLPLKGRAATVLLSLSDAFGKDVGSGRTLIHQKVSQSDLAAMAGMTRENFNRILPGLDTPISGEPSGRVLLPGRQGSAGA